MTGWSEGCGHGNARLLSALSLSVHGGQPPRALYWLWTGRGVALLSLTQNCVQITAELWNNPFCFCLAVLQELPGFRVSSPPLCCQSCLLLSWLGFPAKWLFCYNSARTCTRPWPSEGGVGYPGLGIWDTLYLYLYQRVEALDPFPQGRYALRTTQHVTTLNAIRTLC